MTRKDYEAVARAIASVWETATPKGREAIDDSIQAICVEFAKDNSRFDADRFARACHPLEVR